MSQSGPTPAPGLPARFARRMLPAALFAGLSLAVVPPASYVAATWARLAEQGAVHARHFRAAIRTSIQERPRLWRYDLPKVVRALAPQRSQPDIGTVEIRDCHGHLVFRPEALGVGTGWSRGPAGEARVVVDDLPVATVRVLMDPRPAIGRAKLLGLASSTLGLALALFLYLFPVRVVTRQTRALEATMAELVEAKEHLGRANEHLEEEVAVAVAQVRRLSDRVLSVQEEERARVARDLHDGLGQILTALRLQIDLVAASRARGDTLEQAVALVKEALAETRRAVADLMPPDLDRLGLEGALGTLVEGFESRTGVSAALRVEGEPGSVPLGAARVVYRIVQEALTNVARHADASEVGVSLEIRSGSLILEVWDDGRGFDGPGRGRGLPGIRERARFVGGRAVIESRPGEGTTVSVTIPLEPDA